MITTIAAIIYGNNSSTIAETNRLQFNAGFHYDRCGQGVCHHSWSFVVRDRSDNIKSALTVCVSANFKPFRFGLRFLMA